MDLPVEPLADLGQAHPESWNIVKVGFGRDNANHRIAKVDGAPCMAVFYPANSLTPTSVPKHPLGGLGFYAAPPAIFPANDVEFKYSVLFDAGFNPQKGGKLPGLYISPPGAANFSGGSGGDKTATTASCRIMWRQDLAAEAYVYRPADQGPAYEALPSSVYNATYGDSLWRGILKFSKNAWNQVAIRVRMNAVGQADGFVSVSINGVKCEFDKMIWRTDPSVCVSSVLVDTFYGGSSADYACPCDTYTYFKDFKVTKF